MAPVQGNVSAGSIKDGSLQMVMSATPVDSPIGFPGVSWREDPPLHLQARGKYTSVQTSLSDSARRRHGDRKSVV